MSCEKETNLPSYQKQFTPSKSIHLAICIAFLKVYVYLGNYHHQLNLMSLLIDLQYYPRRTRDIYQYVWHFPFLSSHIYLIHPIAFLPDNFCNMFFHFKSLFNSLATCHDKSLPAQRWYILAKAFSYSFLFEVGDRHVW